MARRKWPNPAIFELSLSLRVNGKSMTGTTLVHPHYPTILVPYPPSPSPDKQTGIVKLKKITTIASKIDCEDAKTKGDSTLPSGGSEFHV